MRIGGEKEDYIKCELIGGGSPRHFSISSIIAAHYTYIKTCSVWLLLQAVSRIPCYSYGGRKN